MLRLEDLPDYSAVIGVGRWAFGLIAFRHRACLVSGDQAWWVAIPSWGAALCVLALGLAEVWVLRFLLRLSVRFSRSRRPSPP